MTKILIHGPAWVGDMVMAQTLFKLLQAQNPGSQLDVIAPVWSEPLLARMPEIHRTFVLPIGHGELKLKARYQFAQNIRQQNYDQAIVLPNSFKSGLIPWFAKIQKRTGWVGEWRYGLLNDWRRLNKQNYPKMIERFAALAFPANTVLPKVLPWPELKVAAAMVEKTLRQHQLSLGKKVLALCPGAEFGPAKCWPADYYAKVAQEKLAQGWQVWLFGSARDQVHTQQIQRLTNNGCHDLAGKTTLAEAIDLLSVVDLVITNDSGLMHISAALKKPLIVIYGSTDPKFTPPLTEHVEILSLNLDCSPCFQRECPLQHLNCLHELKPERVLAATELRKLYAS